MSKIIQLLHSSNEHSHDKNNKTHKSYTKNSEGHKRKFMLSEGKYIDSEGNNKLGKLTFWGEWELSSKVSKLNSRDKYYPKWLHKPYVDNKDIKDALNTDPFVFGNNFYYFVCKQYKQNKETSLTELSVGDMILFGSNKGGYFVLDTLFVVGKIKEYNTSNIDIIEDYIKASEIDENFFNYSFKFANFKCNTSLSNSCNPNLKNNQPLENLNLKIYIGATYDEPVNGMYSFSPAKVYDENENKGFYRVRLKSKEFNFISNRLNTSYKENKIDNINFVWNKIRQKISSKGLVEGVKFML